MSSMAEALLKAGLVNKDTAAEIERERRKHAKELADESLQRVLAAKQRGRNEAQES